MICTSRYQVRHSVCGDRSAGCSTPAGTGSHHRHPPGIDPARPAEPGGGPHGSAFLPELPRDLPARRLLTYGGDPITLGMMTLAKRRGIPVVFGLHNFEYIHRRAFAKVDYCIVPSEFARRHYRDTLGLDCQALPYPVDWDRVRVATATRGS